MNGLAGSKGLAGCRVLLRMVHPEADDGWVGVLDNVDEAAYQLHFFLSLGKWGVLVKLSFFVILLSLCNPVRTSSVDRLVGRFSETTYLRCYV